MGMSAKGGNKLLDTSCIVAKNVPGKQGLEYNKVLQHTDYEGESTECF